MHAGLFLLLICLLLNFSISQKTFVSYDSLVKEYKIAQEYYDKATSLSGAKEYGPREELLEKEWNEKAFY